MDSEKRNSNTQARGGGPESSGGDFIDISPSELFFSSTESLDRLTDHVANGGNLLDFCHLHKIRYSALKRWLNSDPSYQVAYEAAVALQSEVIEEKILRELQRIGQFDIRSIFGEDNCVKPPSEWGDDAGAVISGFEVHELFESDGEGGKNLIGYCKKIKLWDKTKTIESVAKIKQMIGASRKDQAANENDLLAVVNRMIGKRKLALGPGVTPVGVKPSQDMASNDSGSRGSVPTPVSESRAPEVIDVTPTNVEEFYGEL